MIFFCFIALRTDGRDGCALDGCDGDAGCTIPGQPGKEISRSDGDLL